MSKRTIENVQNQNKKQNTAFFPQGQAKNKAGDITFRTQEEVQYLLLSIIGHDVIHDFMKNDRRWSEIKYIADKHGDMFQLFMFNEKTGEISETTGGSKTPNKSQQVIRSHSIFDKEKIFHTPTKSYSNKVVFSQTPKINETNTFEKNQKPKPKTIHTNKNALQAIIEEPTENHNSFTVESVFQKLIDNISLKNSPDFAFDLDETIHGLTEHIHNEVLINFLYHYNYYIQTIVENPKVSVLKAFKENSYLFSPTVSREPEMNGLYEILADELHLYLSKKVGEITNVNEYLKFVSLFFEEESVFETIYRHYLFPPSKMTGGEIIRSNEDINKYLQLSDSLSIISKYIEQNEKEEEDKYNSIGFKENDKMIVENSNVEEKQTAIFNNDEEKSRMTMTEERKLLFIEFMKKVKEIEEQKTSVNSAVENLKNLLRDSHQVDETLLKGIDGTYLTFRTYKSMGEYVKNILLRPLLLEIKNYHINEEKRQKNAALQQKKEAAKKQREQQEREQNKIKAEKNVRQKAFVSGKEDEKTVGPSAVVYDFICMVAKMALYFTQTYDFTKNQDIPSNNSDLNMLKNFIFNCAKITRGNITSIDSNVYDYFDKKYASQEFQKTLYKKEFNGKVKTFHDEKALEGVAMGNKKGFIIDNASEIKDVVSKKVIHPFVIVPYSSSIDGMDQGSWYIINQGKPQLTKAGQKIINGGNKYEFADTHFRIKQEDNSRFYYEGKVIQRENTKFSKNISPKIEISFAVNTPVGLLSGKKMIDLKQSELTAKKTLTETVGKICDLVAKRQSSGAIKKEFTTFDEMFLFAFKEYEEATSQEEKTNTLLHNYFGNILFKGCGDFYQEINAVSKNGSYIGTIQYFKMEKNKKNKMNEYTGLKDLVLRHDTSNQTQPPRLFLANDQPSACRFAFILLNGTEGINPNAYGGFYGKEKQMLVKKTGGYKKGGTRKKKALKKRKTNQTAKRR